MKKICIVLSLSMMISYFGISIPMKAENTVQSYWVSVDGKDENPGTKEQPFKTIAKAQETVRKNKPETMTGDITVYIGAGSYYLDSTLSFTEEDSGNNGYNIIYKNDDTNNAEVGSAELIGGKSVTDWSLYKDGIYYTTLNHDAYMLYEDDEAGITARYPNLIPDENFPMSKAPYLYAACDETKPKNRIAYNEGDFDEKLITQNRDLRVYVWPGGRYDWWTDVVPISSIDTTNNYINLSDSMFYSAWFDYAGTQKGSRYFFMNSLVLLDQSGEFYFDSFNRKLYYKPRHEENLTNGKIIVPTVQNVIKVNGTSESSIVHNIVFEGLTIKDTDFVSKSVRIPSGIGEIESNPNGAINLKFAEDIMFTKCNVKNTGLQGIVLTDWCKRNTISQSLIENIGSTAIQFIGRSYQKGDVNRENKVTDCLIRNFGTTMGAAIGIQIKQSGFNEITNCVIKNGVRSGMHFYGPGASFTDLDGLYTDGNVTKYVKMEDCMQSSGDDGVIHFYGTGGRETDDVHSNTFEQIYINGSFADSSLNDMRPDGIYTDRDAYGQIFRNICVKNVERYDFYAFHYSSTDYVDGHTFDNVSWEDGFNEQLMEYDKIGITADFPFECEERPEKGEEIHAKPIAENDFNSSESLSAEGIVYNDNSGSVTITPNPKDKEHNVALIKVSTAEQTTKNLPELILRFDKQTNGVVVANFDFMANGTITNAKAFQFLDSAGNIVTDTRVSWRGKFDNVINKYWNAADNGSNLAVQAEKWYNVTIRADLDNQIYRYYVDGDGGFKGIAPFQTIEAVRDNISAIRFCVAENAADTSTEMYINNLKIYQESGENTKPSLGKEERVIVFDDFETNEDYDTVIARKGASSIVENVYDEATGELKQGSEVVTDPLNPNNKVIMLKNTVGSGNAYRSYRLPVQGANAYGLKTLTEGGVLEVSYKIYAEKCDGTLLVELYDKNSNNTNMMKNTYNVAGGAMTIGQSNKGTQYTKLGSGVDTSVWHEVKMIIDLDSRTADYFMDGKILKTNQDLNAGGEDGGNNSVLSDGMLTEMRLRIYAGKDSTAYFDDVKIARVGEAAVVSQRIKNGAADSAVTLNTLSEVKSAANPNYEVAVHNSTDETKDYILIAAVYRGNKLGKIYMDTVSADPGKTAIKSIKLADLSSGLINGNIKLYVWNDFEHITPITESVVIQ